MKISYRSRPIFKVLENSAAPNFRSIIQLEDDLRNSMINRWNEYRPICKNNVYILSDSFFDAAFENAEKLVTNFPTQTSDDNADVGVLINGSLTFCYSLGIINAKDLAVYGYAWIFDQDVLIGYFIMKPSGSNEVSLMGDINSKISDNKPELMQNIMRIIMVINIFIKYAPVEVKILPPNKKIKEGDCAYKNETNTSVTYLDCTWFTTLVKSDGFPVRGHFRLQPKKINGQWTKEIIWINEFNKEGYTAPARKLRHSY